MVLDVKFVPAKFEFIYVLSTIAPAERFKPDKSYSIALKSKMLIPIILFAERSCLSVKPITPPKNETLSKMAFVKSTFDTVVP